MGLPGMIPAAGGIPIVVGGKIIGAIGVSGAAPIPGSPIGSSRVDALKWSFGIPRRSKVMWLYTARAHVQRLIRHWGEIVIRQVSLGMSVGLCLAALQLATAPAVSAKDLKVLSEKTITGFGHVEIVAYDPRDKALYVSDFGPDFKDAAKDGKGKITKISLDGKILEEKFLPAKGQVSISRKESGSEEIGFG